MWQADLVEVIKENGNLKVKVNYNNGVVVYTKDYLISEPDSIKRIIKDQINQYQKIEDFQPTLGIVDLSEPVEAKKEVAVEVAKNQGGLTYLEKREDLIIAKKDLELGIIEQSDYDTLLAETKALK